jgi:hypothetical protein
MKFLHSIKEKRGVCRASNMDPGEPLQVGLLALPLCEGTLESVGEGWSEDLE